ncbi:MULTISPECIES: HNH endonuclease [unclassified Halomonas]|uniref:HNH endonuclease n=1 Tax=unclassified Halomonas TaxID=2609666 RepID=UPI002076BC23|nr:MULTISPECIES: HNH endonuclease [unclassified Halomonas]
MNELLGSLEKLNVGKSKGKPAPNKPCLLMAVICEIQSGYVDSPRIDINERLIARYFDIYEAATNDRAAANPHLPLWHLRSDKGPSGSLWVPIFKSGLEQHVGQLGQPKSLKSLKERFVAVYLDSALYNAFKSQEYAWKAGDILIARYFHQDLEAQKRLRTYTRLALDSGEYVRNPQKLKGTVRESFQRYARSAAFRTLVLEAYDYRCAASRLRYITPDYRYLTEAAHLIPFAVSQDDRPVNGLALTRDLHWAMDHHLIAPGPDLKWHVSKRIDRLVDDNRWLYCLDGQPLVVPREPVFRPDEKALAWRFERLQR